MGLNLIRRGPRNHPTTVEGAGSGWVNVLAPSVYLGSGVFTAQATGCDGVRIYDWNNSMAYVEDTAGTAHHARMIVTTTAVVRVLNPTENTEVTIMSETIPPPYFVEFLRRLWGGCRGAKANRSALYPQGVHRAREGRECQSDRLGKFLSGAFVRVSQDHRRGHGKRFGARRNVDFLNDTVPIAGAQRARLNGVGSDCSKGAGALSECVALRARRCAGSGGALSRTLSTAGVGA